MEFDMQAPTAKSPHTEAESYRADSMLGAFLLLRGAQFVGCEGRGASEPPFFLFRPADLSESLASDFYQGATVVGAEYARSLGLVLNLAAHAGFVMKFFREGTS